MSATVEFYLARAAQDARAAKETDLANVRERCLRSEAVWRDMAARQTHIENKKQQDAQEKAARNESDSGYVRWPMEAAKRQAPIED